MDVFTFLAIPAGLQLRFSGPAALVFAVLMALGPQALSAAQSARVPAAAKALYAEGMQELQRGNLQAAHTAFQKVVKMTPNSAEAHNSLGWVWLAEEQVAETIRHVQHALQL